MLPDMLGDIKRKQAGECYKTPRMMIMIPELNTEVVINRDIPREHLKRGDLALYIDMIAISQSSGREDGAVLELFNALGESLRVVAVPISAIEPLRPDYIPAVRIGEQTH
jgi:hypothetical protein